MLLSQYQHAGEVIKNVSDRVKCRFDYIGMQYHIETDLTEYEDRDWNLIT
jgi:hypothetical protein